MAFRSSRFAPVMHHRQTQSFLSSLIFHLFTSLILYPFSTKPVPLATTNVQFAYF
ncbi:hypothetical protein EJ02DRAFT_450169 [Clathrospora elynae]|uniref:Uncharacterized protein n=1 Tax=Clathrospora elynae TaxID=706981 RepID=A0A6A5T512_9PLEO|nr:hypothetical protein EJ02DRAFT_450169 [Clathrospora elynae]